MVPCLGQADRCQNVGYWPLMASVTIGSNNMDTESVDLIDAWHDLYVMLGTSSAALIGLLFIATSMHLGEVVSNPGFRVRSYNQTLYLLTLLVEAVLILVPQPVRNDRHRGGMKMSRAIPLSVAYGHRPHPGLSMGDVHCAYTTLLVTVLLGAWSTMLGIQQRQLAVEQREKAGS